MSNAALRPGIALGPYPERAEAQPGVVDRVAARAFGWLAQRQRGRPPWFNDVVAAINAHDGELRVLADDALSEVARELRMRLRSEGLTDPLIARAFALVRETASRQIGLRHHDVQLVGGWVMIHGMLAEMETGEGKTLTATLPACTAALAGIPVHIITVNDYLVGRDAEWMRPIYEHLGLSVGSIEESMDAAARQVNYAADVTYCSNKQVAFDYLKDRIVLGKTPGRLRLELEGLYQRAPRLEKLLLRGLCFAIVDEADSVLIDEARTPLIISRGVELKDQQQTYDNALAVAGRLRVGADYLVETRDRRIELTERGKNRTADLSRDFGGFWRSRLRREELVKQALSAHQLFKRDNHYLVRDGKVQIIDEFTGRIMADRSWERGLHQMIEAKEGVELTGQRDTLARISYQRFFRRYLRLAGMTGTAREVASELWTVYRLKVVAVPSHRLTRRVDVGSRVYGNSAAKWAAVVDAVRVLHAAGRPVLVGTRSVGDSEHLSERLHEAGLPHRVLNARQDAEEADIVAQAGGLGRITVATNMAGRGTDIALSAEVLPLGGLHVIAAERHEAGRIDRQLFGRCARQGDPGSFEAMVSLDDELFDTYCANTTVWFLRRLARQSKPIPIAANAVARAAQRSAQRRHGEIRRQLLQLDDRLGDALAFSGRME